MECPFCKIIEKQAEAHVIYESENIIAFLDIDPINEGHVLIVPKLHEASIDNMPINTLTEIMETLQKVVTALKEVYNIDGYSVMQNGGEFCDFGHGHFHVFPRYKNDGFGWKYPEGTFECSAKVAERLRNAMRMVTNEQ
ncbi:MAG: HIT family protein [Roseburia sp.]|nr:HIT family protein [Roseburia sp.]